VSAGCNSDIVSTSRLKMLEHKCVYIAPPESEDPQVGKVVRDVIEKELIRRQVELCDPNTSTIFITGATFLTARSTSNQTFLAGSSVSSQSIEIVSLVAKDRDGQELLSASYDNKERYNASKLAQEFGQALVNRFK
jgi:hypothetical protein